jgi:hypothetical protein
MVGALGMTDSLISYVAMEEGLNDRNVVARVLSDPDGRERTERLLRDAKAAAKEQLDRPGATAIAEPARGPIHRPVGVWTGRLPAGRGGVRTGSRRSRPRSRRCPRCPPGTAW